MKDRKGKTNFYCNTQRPAGASAERMREQSKVPVKYSKENCVFGKSLISTYSFWGVGGGSEKGDGVRVDAYSSLSWRGGGWVLMGAYSRLGAKEGSLDLFQWV